MLQEQYIDTQTFQILEAPTEMEALDYKILSWLGCNTQINYGKLKGTPEEVDPRLQKVKNIRFES